ncbi:type II toxin-antitoxin system death-on-curing family toxin [[Pseudopropionibacterium] massiliense]|uniref:type II toxin-antitoxin system death-on-curing family toxin n=1 Tax=[Pseudopropionibacterium] massiliense TaxID=2220000 RepID=UPI001FEA72D0|nr:Fic family protein [[Pseudopropionibacterium] massiliense]
MTTRIGLDLCLKIYWQEVNAGSLCDREKLESTLAQPFQSFGGTDLYPTLIEKVARLTFGIAEAQAFQDGNKRLAWLIAVIFLNLNGMELDVDQDEAAHVIRALGIWDKNDQRLLDYAGLIKWFNDCTKITVQ